MSTEPSIRYVIVANPTAGRGRASGLAEQVNARLQRSGAQSRVEYTRCPGDAETIAKTVVLEESDDGGAKLCVVSCGGDGTNQEVVNALLSSNGNVQRDVALGIAPAGRCNDFASAFGIPRDPAHVGEVLLGGNVRRVDLGRINGRYFCTVAAFGFDAAVSRFVNDMRLPMKGTLAYVYGVLHVLTTYKPIQARLAMDDSTIEGPVYLAASANTPSYGGKLYIAPDASALDGLLDVCLVCPLARLAVLKLLHRALRRVPARVPEVRLVRGRSLRIETDTSQEIWADGELVTETPVTIEAVPEAIQLLIPSEQRGPWTD